jgi:hypothetical protein
MLDDVSVALSTRAMRSGSPDWRRAVPAAVMKPKSACPITDRATQRTGQTRPGSP